MDYSKIKLSNERNTHVTKRLNRLNTWNFFKVLYRDNLWRLFGFSILMILCIAPIIVMMLLGQAQSTALKNSLPMLGGLGFSTGYWQGVEQVYQSGVNNNNLVYGLYCVACSALVAVLFSGGFAVIRDAFWTGKLSTVGVFKSMGKGFAANFFYALFSAVVLGASIFGLFMFYSWASVVMPLWLAIVLLVLLCILDMFVAVYLLILCSVSVTYKQSLAQNLDDAWRLMWLNILPNIIHFLIALIPIGLYFIFNGGILFSLYMVLCMMFGGMYFPLVWQTHMMKTFALFHPVEPRSKKGKNQGAKVAEVGDFEPEEPKQSKQDVSNGKTASDKTATEKTAKDNIAQSNSNSVEADKQADSTATDNVVSAESQVATDSQSAEGNDSSSTDNK